VETDSEPRPVDRVIDPYWVLGVGRGASPEQIEAAYRRAAGNAWSSERRREIESAYELLTSPERRA
jgi:DnaJ-class molecular chaperone